MLATTGPLIAVTELGGKTVWLAALQASAVGYLTGAFIAGRTKVSRAILVGNIALMSYAVPLVLFAFAAPAWAVVVGYGLAMACLGFLNPVWETAVQQEVPPEVLARVSAYDWLVSLGAMPLGVCPGARARQGIRVRLAADRRRGPGPHRPVHSGLPARCPQPPAARSRRRRTPGRPPSRDGRWRGI